jgi:hypothetical protein
VKIHSTLCALLACLASLLCGYVGRADPPVPRTSFAVVIGNNRSLGNRRPDLHYADDDAAKYFDILQTVAPGRVTLLADFDEDTARLFPEEHSHASMPTRAELLRIGQELAGAVRGAARVERETDLYFVFAGHGDVDEGMGFIELADARFTSADLESWLRAIPFSRAHVILDSCNSFFMLGARRPGGRYYATPEDAARALSARLPNVGVFLSTSAEGESFEWSELQSGVFSHVVRSGLLGAADADGDGAVSYVELAAFVATATADVRNPTMRPHVYARGPVGRDDARLIAVNTGKFGARTFRLSDSAPMRVRLLDQESVPILDAHEEAGQALVVSLPEAWAQGAVVERPGAGDLALPLETFALSAPDAKGELVLASHQPVSTRGAARGPAEIFHKLFARPFGPHAFASYVAQAGTLPPPVYGVSREDAERMDLLLGQIESAEHGQRLLSGLTFLGLGAIYGVAGASTLYFAGRLDNATRNSSNVWGGTLVGLGAIAAAYGVYSLAMPWSGEQAALEYRAALGSGTDYARAFAAADARLQVLAEREKRRRWWLRGIGTVVVAGSIALVTYNEVTASSPTQRLDGRLFGGTAALLGGVMVGVSYLIESPIERLMRVWERDPAMRHLQPTEIAPQIAPTAGGFTFGLTGRF